jgi:uncharacterized protein
MNIEHIVHKVGAGSADPVMLHALKAIHFATHRLAIVAASRDCTSSSVHRSAAMDLLLGAEVADPLAVSKLFGQTHECLLDPRRQSVAEYLPRLAAAAGIVSGLPFRIEVEVRSGRVILPTIGMAVGLRATKAVVENDHAGFRIVGNQQTVAADGAGWVNLRRIELPHLMGRLAVVFQDQESPPNIYPVSRRTSVSHAEFGSFRSALSEAWGWVVSHMPAEADAVASLVTTIVPLSSLPSGRSASAVHRHALGCIALSCNQPAAKLAELLVHELQHVKFNAIRGLVPLYRQGQDLHRAPWRLDPRPIDALLNGAYAHLGVAEYWREQQGAKAEFYCAYYLDQVKQALLTAQASNELTEAGTLFADAMNDRVNANGGLVPGRYLVEDLSAVSQMRWAFHNHIYNSGDIKRCLDEVMCGDILSIPPPQPVLQTSPSPDRPSRLETELRRVALGESSLTVPAAMTRDDYALLHGDPNSASDGYIQRIATDDKDIDAWIGLLLALRARKDASAKALMTYPALIRSISRLGALSPVIVTQAVASA